MPNVLHLNLKGEYFDQIANGSKKDEYRLYNDYWCKRLLFRQYDWIVIKRGYPKRGDTAKTLERIWRGWRIENITHPLFGKEQVTVFAIRVNE